MRSSCPKKQEKKQSVYQFAAAKRSCLGRLRRQGVTNLSSPPSGGGQGQNGAMVTPHRAHMRGRWSPDLSGLAASEVTEAVEPRMHRSDVCPLWC